MENIQILNYKQIKETFKTMSCKYMAIKENNMASPWGEPAVIDALEKAVIGKFFASAEEAKNYFYNNYAKIMGVEEDDLYWDDVEGIYGVPVTENNEIVFVK